MTETRFTDLKINELGAALNNNNNNDDIAELINCVEDDYVPMRERLPKLTEDDYRQISRCRYIRKSHRQCQGPVSPERIDTPVFWNLSFMKKPLTLGIAKATIKEEDGEAAYENNTELMKKDQPSVQSQTKATVFPPLNNSSASVCCPLIKPQIPLVAKSTDAHSHFVQEKPETLHRKKMEELRLDFSKCNVSKTKTKLTPLASSSDNCHPMNDVGKRKENLRTKPSKRTEQLYKEISSVAKNLDMSLNDVVRDVKEQRGKKGSLVSILKLRKKGLKKWSLLAKLVRSGWLFRKESRILKQINKQRHRRKSMVVTSESRAFKSDPFRFGAPRKFNIHTTEETSLLSSVLPHLPMRFLDKALSTPSQNQKDVNKREGSFDVL